MSRRTSSTLVIAPAVLMLAAVTIAAQLSGHPMASIPVAIGAALAGVVVGVRVGRLVAGRLVTRLGASRRSSDEPIPGFEAQASTSGATSL
jgi:hypothetical protein